MVSFDIVISGHWGGIEWSFKRPFKAPVLPRVGEKVVIDCNIFTVTAIDHDLTDNDGIILWCDEVSVSNVELVVSKNGRPSLWQETTSLASRDRFRKIFMDIFDYDFDSAFKPGR